MPNHYILPAMSEDTLRRVFGISKLRPWQEEALPHILNGDDVFVMVSTGAGKSIMYQYPASLDGEAALTLVISPTRSLQMDQVDALNRKGVRAALLNSDLTLGERNCILDHLDTYALLYCAPEQLRSKDLQTALGRVALKRVVIDEAHILPEAKHSFRPAYNEIGEFIRSRSSRPQIIALTATATPKSRQQIKTDLGMKWDTATFVYPIRRKNLEIQTKLIKANKKAAMSESDVMLRAVEDILRQWDQKGSAIIYGTTVEQVNTAKKFLKGRGFDLKKVTGKMKCKKRRKNQDAFMHGRVSIMVATNAFGLGVDKPDVRLVIHMGLPLTLEGYVQEIGRAGRDGKKSTCVLLYTQSDYKRNKRILKAGGEEAFQWFEQGMKAVHGFADDKTTCAWRKIEKYFGEKPSKRCRVCSNCIAKKLIG